MPSLPADGTQWSLGAQEAAEPDVHEPTSWEGAGATDDPNTIVVMGIISLPTGGDVGASVRAYLLYGYFTQLSHVI